jgi:hypothetical protein
VAHRSMINRFMGHSWETNGTPPGRRTGAIGWLRTHSSLGISLVLLLAAVMGCDRGSEGTVVASVDDFSLTLEQVSSEYDRVNGEGMWAQTTVDERADFAALLLDKQMLLGLAREHCPEPDVKRARMERVLAEKALLRICEQWRRDQFPFSAEREAELVQLLGRAAKVRSCVVSSDHMKDATEAVKANASFEEIVELYGNPGRDGSVKVDTMDIAVGVAGREAINMVLLADPSEGSVVGPIVTRLGPLVCEILSFELIELDADPRILDTAKDFALDYDYLPVQHAFFDSLRAAAAIQVHDEAVTVLRERFAGFWDSVRAIPDFDLQTLRAPMWRFDEADRAVPAFESFGETHTVGDFVASLDDVDLDSWPPLGEQARIKSMVEQRLLRMLVERQAIQEGCDRNPEYLAALDRTREQQQLEQFRDRFLITQVEVPEERLRKQYEENPANYQTAEQMAFGMLTFPASEEARARELRASLETGESWDEAALAEVARGTGVVFEPDTGLRSIRVPPDKPSIPYRNLASTLKVGEFSEVTPIGDNVAIVRCNDRAPARPSTFEEARPKIFRTVQQIVLDEEIERRLEVLRAEQKPVVNRELLAGSPTSET